MYMGAYMVWVWLALLVLFIITEIATVQLTTVWFAGGALIAMLLAACGVKSIIIQIIVFLAVSIILLVATRPLVIIGALMHLALQLFMNAHTAVNLS
jgi:membrane protein implicated in regulation of membrane protease activity